MDRVPFLRLKEYETWATQLSKVEEMGAALRSRGVLSTLEPVVGDLVFENDLLAHFAGVANPVERRIHAAQRGFRRHLQDARAYITPERAVWVELVPEKGGEVAPLAMISAKVSAPPTDNFGHSLTVAPPRLGAVREFRLDNGLRVVMVPFGNAPLVHVALADEGPSLGDALDWTHTAFDIGGTVPTVGNRYGVPGLTLAARAIGKSSSTCVLLDGRPTYRLDASSDDLGSALYLVRIAGPESTLATDSVRVWNKQVKKQKPEPAVTAWYAGLDALLGSETTRTVRRTTLIDKTSLVRQHELWHRPETSTLYVVGKIEEDAEAMIRAAFEGWAAPAVTERSDPPASPVVLPDRAVPLTVVVDGQGRASVSLACRMLRYSLAERSLLQHAVQDATYLEARERQGLVYAPWVGTIDLGADVPATLLLVGAIDGRRNGWPTARGARFVHHADRKRMVGARAWRGECRAGAANPRPCWTDGGACGGRGAARRHGEMGNRRFARRRGIPCRPRSRVAARDSRW